MTDTSRCAGAWKRENKEEGCTLANSLRRGLLVSTTFKTPLALLSDPAAVEADELLR